MSRTANCDQRPQTARPLLAGTRAAYAMKHTSRSQVLHRYAQVCLWVCSDTDLVKQLRACTFTQPYKED